MTAILPPHALEAMHAYWRAAHCLSVGQIYLLYCYVRAGYIGDSPLEVARGLGRELE